MFRDLLCDGIDPFPCDIGHPVMGSGFCFPLFFDASIPVKVIRIRDLFFRQRDRRDIHGRRRLSGILLLICIPCACIVDPCCDDRCLVGKGKGRLRVTGIHMPVFPEHGERGLVRIDVNFCGHLYDRSFLASIKRSIF